MLVYRFSEQYHNINEYICIYSSHPKRHVSASNYGPHRTVLHSCKSEKLNPLPFYIKAELHYEGRNYWPKHVVVDVVNKYIYNHLYCCFTRRIIKPILTKQTQRHDYYPPPKKVAMPSMLSRPTN